MTNDKLTKEYFGMMNSIYALEDFKFYVTTPAHLAMPPVGTLPLEPKFMLSALTKSS